MLTLLTGIALLLIPIPIFRLFFVAGFRRRLMLFPRRLIILCTAITLYITAGLGVLVWFPDASLILLLLAIAILVYLHVWRAREDYLKHKGVPPGSLRIAPVGPWTDYLFYLKRTRQLGPIYKMSHFVHPMVCINELSLAYRFLKEHGSALSTPPMPFNRFIPSGFMRYMKPEIHAEYRYNMKRVFTDNSILRHHESRADRLFTSSLERMSEARGEEHPDFYLSPAVFEIFALLFLGIDKSDPDFTSLKHAISCLDYRRAWQNRPGTVEQALLDMESLLDRHSRDEFSFYGKLQAIRSITTILGNDTSIRRNMIFILLTASIDVADLVNWVFYYLHTEPGWLNSVRHSLQSGEPTEINRADALAERIVKETLRLEQSEYLMRQTLKDVSFNGFTIPRGWLVRIGIRECHLDERRITNPMAFDPDRFMDGGMDSSCFEPFGLDANSCLGRRLTLWCAQRFVLALARRPPLKRLSDGSRELGAFHWRPSADLRVSEIA